MKTEKQPDRESVKSFLLWPFRAALKFAAAVLLIVYVFVGTTATVQLYKKNMYRAQDLNSLYAKLDDMAAGGTTPRAVTEWIAARPLAETDKLIEIVTPKSAPFGAELFLEFFRRARLRGRTEDALFWLELGRFRFLYDVIRCGAPPGEENKFDPVFRQLRSDETDALLRAHPDMLQKTAQRILDFDAKYPAHDDPATVCKVILPATQLPADEINWEGYRQALRRHIQELLKNPDKIDGKK